MDSPEKQPDAYQEAMESRERAMESELKAASCPFCGGSSIEVEPDEFQCWEAYCGDCVAAMVKSRDAAIAAWNRRPEPPVSAREERLAEALVYLLGPVEGPDWDDATADSILAEARAVLAASPEPANRETE